MTHSLDDIDRKLLTLLQQDARLSAEELGARAGVSRSAAQRRVQKLREAKVIERDIAVVSPKAVGQPMMVIVEVELEHKRIDLQDEFRRSMAALEEVQQCYYVTGHTDFVAIVLVEDMERYQEFTRQVFAQNPNIRRFHTNVVVDRVKVGLHTPML